MKRFTIVGSNGAAWRVKNSLMELPDVLKTIGFEVSGCNLNSQGFYIFIKTGKSFPMTIRETLRFLNRRSNSWKYKSGCFYLEFDK